MEQACDENLNDPGCAASVPRTGAGWEADGAAGWGEDVADTPLSGFTELHDAGEFASLSVLSTDRYS